MSPKKNTVDWYVDTGLDRMWDFVDPAIKEEIWEEVPAKDDGGGGEVESETETESQESTSEQSASTSETWVPRWTLAFDTIFKTLQEYVHSLI